MRAIICWLRGHDFSGNTLPEWQGKKCGRCGLFERHACKWEATHRDEFGPAIVACSCGRIAVTQCD